MHLFHKQIQGLFKDQIMFFKSHYSNIENQLYNVYSLFDPWPKRMWYSTMHSSTNSENKKYVLCKLNFKHFSMTKYAKIKIQIYSYVSRKGKLSDAKNLLHKKMCLSPDIQFFKRAFVMLTLVMRGGRGFRASGACHVDAKFLWSNYVSRHTVCT